MKNKETAYAGETPVYCAHDEIVPLVDVKPNPRNPNRHPEEQIQLLARIIKHQGWRAPITISTLSGMIVRGHGRLMAARRLGASSCPVDYQDYNTEAEEWSDLIADNRLAELSGLDDNMVYQWLQELDDGKTDLRLTGYTEEALTALCDQVEDSFGGGPAGEDDVTGPGEEEPLTRDGDLWLLGEHRLLCGDATRQEDLGHLMAGNLAHMIFTDPPYGISYVASSDKFGGQGIEGDDNTLDELITKVLAPAFKLMAQHATAEAAFYIWHAYQTRKEYDYAITAAGLAERQYLTWVKPSMVLGQNDYRNQAEPVYYCSKAGRRPKFYGDRAQSSIWYVTLARTDEISISLGQGVVLLDGQGGQLALLPSPPGGKGKTKKMRHLRIAQPGTAVMIDQASEAGTVWEVKRDSGHEHPTQKPVELARRAIENSSLRNQVVLDPFLGSGTTLIGAEATGRTCYGLEMDPKYCDVIVRRWESYTKRKAERIPAGENTGGEEAGAVEESSDVPF